MGFLTTSTIQREKMQAKTSSVKSCRSASFNDPRLVNNAVPCMFDLLGAVTIRGNVPILVGCSRVCREET